MGWLERSASYYKGNKIDKVAEVKKMFDYPPQQRVIKTVMIGNEIYMALEKNTNGKTKIIPTVCLFRDVNNKRGTYFYKESYYDGWNFPKSLLKLIQANDDVELMKWKAEQLKFLAEKKQKVKLENGDKIIFTNSSFGGENEWIYSGKYNGSHLFYNTKYGYKKLKGWTKADYEIIKKTA